MLKQMVKIHNISNKKSIRMTIGALKTISIVGLLVCLGIDLTNLWVDKQVDNRK